MRIEWLLFKIITHDTTFTYLSKSELFYAKAGQYKKKKSIFNRDLNEHVSSIIRKVKSH